MSLDNNKYSDMSLTFYIGERYDCRMVENDMGRFLFSVPGETPITDGAGPCTILVAKSPDETFDYAHFLPYEKHDMMQWIFNRRNQKIVSLPLDNKKNIIGVPIDRLFAIGSPITRVGRRR